MVNPSTESILNQMTNLAMDIALDYVLPASPMSDVCKSDLFEFERDVVVAAVSGGATADSLLSSLVAGTAGTTGGCCGRPPTDLCKKNSYMGAAGCDSCDACLAKNAAATATADVHSPSTCTASTTVGVSSASPPSSTASSTTSSASSTPSQQQTAETTMDISWCQFDGCEFDTADNSYLDICDWIFYADRYALTDENREKVQKAFQMVPPGEVTGYVAETPNHSTRDSNAAAERSPVGTSLAADEDPAVAAVAAAAAAAAIVGGVTVKSEPDDDYLWTSDNHLLPIILKAEPNADILQITELDHSYLQTPTSHGGCGSNNSSTAVSPVKLHPNHLVDMLGLVTPPPSRSQSSEEEEIDVVNDSWDTPDTPRKGATMADIMKRGIVKKREPPVTKWKNTVKRKHKTAGQSATAAAVAAAYPMPPPPPKKMCGGLSLLDRYKKDTNWKGAIGIKDEPVIKEEPLDDAGSSADDDRSDDDEYDNRQRHRRKQRQQQKQQNALTPTIKSEPLDEDEDRRVDDDDEEDDDYDMDADFESLMKNEPEDMFDDEYDDYDDDHDMDWDKVLRGTSASSAGRGSKSSGGSSSCSSSSTGGARKKKKKKKKKTSASSASAKSSAKLRHQQQQQSGSSGKKIKYENVSGGYSYKTKLMDPVKRALHNDLEKSRRVETSMLFMNLSMQVSFLDDNRKIPSKLSILRGAKRECDLMMLDERRLLSEKHVMQQKQRMLRERLFELRREHYHRRYGKQKQTSSHHSHNQQHHQQQQ
ncbi:uncharacterized protein LOC112597638 [Melanaphis sacchari]|uniref:Transcriptional regulator Myc-2 n=1 Tax=Melanaphis sacchari TaxID=742174 RepID=A0A2H8TDU8_9HEMI|nr:uncharacterized protein LOC112597638 [Melanaphis sacchari]